MRKLFLFLVPCLLLAQSALAQKKEELGFLGNRRELSVDLFNAIYQQQYSLYYKHLLKDNFGLMVNPSYQNYSRDEVDVLDNIRDNNMAKNAGLGLGLIYNSKRTGLPLPVGFYVGAGAEYIKGRFTEEVYKENVLVDSDSWKQSTKAFKLYYGRNTFLFHNFNLDINLVTGFAFSTVRFDEIPRAENSPNGIYPNYSPLFESYIGSKYNTDKKKMRYTTFILMPSILLGYMF